MGKLPLAIGRTVLMFRYPERHVFRCGLALALVNGLTVSPAQFPSGPAKAKANGFILSIRHYSSTVSPTLYS
jgi:hypothetical protein